MKCYRNLCFFFLFCLCFLLLSACQKLPASDVSRGDTFRDNTPVLHIPKASGSQVLHAENTTIDISNQKDGYFMVQYTGDSEKVRIQITSPDGTKRQPLLAPGNEYQTFPFSEGDGMYQITVLEHVLDNNYAVLLSESVDVRLSDEFQPFLHPNQYVNYTDKTVAVSKGAELAKGSTSDLDVVQKIYHYVITNIIYDKQKATSVKDGYLPDIDETLQSQKGICFDYASLMTCMMRTQRIPTKLEIGYSGDVKHAWISAYLKEKGWVDHIIEFDGSSWTLMDPTLASNNDRKAVEKYIEHKHNYTLQYSY